MRFTRLRTSRFTLSRPMSESSSAMSLSKSGFSAGFSSASAAGAAASPEGWALFPTGCLSMNEGSPLVTKSLAFSALLEGLTPAESQTAERRSAQSVMNSASA